MVAAYRAWTDAIGVDSAACIRAEIYRPREERRGFRLSPSGHGDGRVHARSRRDQGSRHPQAVAVGDGSLSGNYRTYASPGPWRTTLGCALVTFPGHHHAYEDRPDEFARSLAETIRTFCKITSLRACSPPRRRLAVLATACLAVFAIDLDTTIVNVALPSLSRQLGAGTSTLQWVVDGYSLAFAALVLAGGSLGDRYGRRPVLAHRPARLRGGIRSGRRRAPRRGAGRPPVRDGGLRRAGLPDHVVRHHQRLSRPGRAEPGPSGYGAPSPAWGWRWDRSPAGCCWLTSGTGRCSGRWFPRP